MKNKAFTLIELLAVIIILGILMLIAIPSVTSYINNSRKNTYVSTIQELIKATSTKVNAGELDIYDTGTTYYVPVSSLKLENGDPKSPYGDFEEAYVVVTYDGEDYDYYFVGKDETDMGTNKVIRNDILKSDDIDSGIGTISTDVGVGKRTAITVFDDEGNILINKDALKKSNPDTGELLKEICRRADVSTLHSQQCKKSETTGNCGVYTGVNVITTFGNIETTPGVLNIGDAFDCDVNGDGTYNPETERFYYVSDYYDVNSSNLGFDHSTAILIFYTNYDSLSTNEKNTENGFAYSTIDENWHGPNEAIRHLPTTEEWSNVRLKSDTRRILGTHQFGPSAILEKNELGYEYPREFSYEGRSARLLTMMEYNEACTVPEYSYVRITPKCIFLNEHTGYFEESRNRGFWFETPIYDSDRAAVLAPLRDTINSNPANFGMNDNWNVFGIRPVIEVAKVDMEY